MKNWLRGMVALGAVGAPFAMATSCATKGTGSETHFVCQNDEGCLRTGKGTRCVEHLCTGSVSSLDKNRDGGQGGASNGGSSEGGRRSADASTGSDGGRAPDDGSTGTAGRVTTDASAGGRENDTGCGDTQSDAANCGKCGHVCGAGTTCVEGECHCTNCGGPDSIAVDSTHVYFTTGPLHAQSIMKQPLAGGTPIALVTLNYVAGMTMDANNIYYVGPNDFSVYDALFRIPKQGGPTFKMLSDDKGFLSLVNDGTSAYWTDQVSPGSGGYSVMKMPLDADQPSGSSLAVIQSDFQYPVAMAADSTGVYVMNLPNDEVVDGGGYGDGQILRVPRDGGTPVVLVTAPMGGPFTGSGGIALDATNIYWASPQQIMKAPRAGGAYTVLASRQDWPATLAVDATNVYWSNYGPNRENDGAIMTVPIAGGTPRALATGQTYPFGIAIDQDYVYWSDQVTGTAKRVHK